MFLGPIALTLSMVGWIEKNSRYQGPHPLSVAVMTPTGQNLSSLFDGLSPNPLYAPQEFAKHRREPRCGRQDQKTLSDRVFGILSRVNLFKPVSVHAQCSTSNCSGEYRSYDYLNCGGAAECYGTVGLPGFDPAYPDQGECRNGSNCGSAWWCGCNIKTCTNMGGNCPNP